MKPFERMNKRKFIKTDQYEKDWDWYGQLIDDRKDSEQWALPRRIRETHWCEFFAFRPGERVLDAGCGNGDYTVLALEKGVRISAFDLARNMITCTQKRLERLELSTEMLMQSSVVAIPFRDSTFDVVLCLAVLNHVPIIELPLALSEISRVLHAGGRAYLNVPNRLALHWRAGLFLMQRLGLMLKGRTRFFTPWQFKKYARKAGFSIQRSMGLWVFPPISGIYTTDLRRITIFPNWLIEILDRLFLAIEIRLRRLGAFKPFCFHYFIEVQKPE